MSYRLDDWDSIPGRGRLFLYYNIQTGPGAHPVSYPVSILGGGGLSLWVRQLGHEADHSPPSTVKVKNAWSYIYTRQYIFMVWCLIKYRDNFNLV
jgi:hypothetical protein